MTQLSELARIKAAFVLDRLSSQVKSDVLADGAIAGRFDLELEHPIQLADNLVCRREDLFAAFARTADKGRSVALPKIRGARISISDDYAGVVTLGRRRWRFRHAALLTTIVERRSQIVEVLFERNTLFPAVIKEIRARIGKTDFDHTDFHDVTSILSSSPESFVERLEARVAVQQVGKRDLLPEDARHWDNLTAPILSSSNFSDYLTHELMIVRQDRLAAEPLRAFLATSLTFSSSALVPLGLLRSIDVDSLCLMIDKSLSLDDHFALIGAFELCADALARDSRFSELGERVLERLFGDMNHLTSTCSIFAAAFIIASAHFSEHQSLRGRPVFWRRLAAAAHASLIVRTCDLEKIEPDNLVGWALRVAGRTYFASVLAEMGDEPRWRPEWIFSNFLIADAVGRVRNAIASILGKEVPYAWTQRLESVLAWINEQKIGPAMTFPSVLEGVPRPVQADLSVEGPLTNAYKAFFADPTLDHFLFIGQLLYSFGVPPEIAPKIGTILDLIRLDKRSVADPPINSALALAASITVQLKDVALADAVADLCVDKCSSADEAAIVLECVFRLIECAQAYPDRKAARNSLVRWLERLAFRIPAGVGSDLAEALLCITEIRPEMSDPLSKAMAAARLAGARLPAI
ncbi:hypothetical protein [Inquilinus sp. OTU3971]|uniref:hypothetical protein n=1 Tax=Inquilinus sp. OTU3971 TaxID=3043855 RepID=UPI00313B784F